METKFTSLDDKKQGRKTVFTKWLNEHFNLSMSVLTPELYENVLHIGFDKCYGDVFKCWNNDINEFTICFGTAGDEFNK